MEEGKKIEKRGGMMPLIVIAVILLLVGGFFLLSRQKSTTTEEMKSSGASEEGSAATSEDLQKSLTPTSKKEISVEGKEYTFSPNSITLSKGDLVRLTFRNTGRMPHNLTIDELGVATKTISSGASDTVEFTASKSGTFTFYCSVGNHKAQGMKGSLKIE